MLFEGQVAGQNTNSIVAGMIDRCPWKVWDTLIEGSGQMLSQYTLFQIPIGALNPLTGVANTKLQTNMTKSGAFPNPMGFLMQSIGFYFSPSMSKADIDLITLGCYMEFKINNKVFHEGLLWHYPGGGGMAGVSTQTGESVYTNGIPAPQFMMRFGGFSRYIAPEQQFSLTLNFPGTPPTLTGTNNLLIATLDGLADQPVQ